MSAEGFADQLRRHRLAAGMTQESLAELSGLSVRGISDLERGLKQRPHPETVRLLAAALELSPESLASFKASATPRSPIAPMAIPEPLTPLIDREEEVRSVAAHMQPDSGIRLLTLTGPGGVGKTRLAIRVTSEVRGSHADGIAFVALAGLTDWRLVLAAMATALGIRDLSDRSPLDLLTRQLQDRQVLVVLDNFEHLLAAAPDLATLLARCRGLSFLATSRAPLRVSGEREYPVRPLALPDLAASISLAEMMRVPAVSLFVQQAQAVKPQFDVTDANATAVAAICARVDGLPLALELAAVRMKSLAPSELESLLGNTLGVLTGGAQDQPTRHQTVRATIGWSHDLLPREDQEAFRRFSVFPTGASLESAAAVVAPGDTLKALDRLTALLDQSLVQRYEGSDGQPRFVMLETIREFAIEQLTASDEEPPVRDLHAAHFLQVAEEGETELTGPHQATWMARLEAEYGNFRDALGWSIERGDAPASQRMGSALWRFWSASGRLNEGRTWLERALALEPDERSVVRAQALQRQGNIAVDLADFPSAGRLFEESLSIFRALDDDLSASRALGGLGLVHWSQGNYAAARVALESVKQTCQTKGWQRGEALAQQNLGNVAVAEGDYAGGRHAFDASLAIRRELGDTGGVAWIAHWRGRLDRLEGRTDDARRWLTRALAGFREVDDILGTAFALNELGSLAHDLNDNHAALAHHLDALREREEVGDTHGAVECLEGLSAVALAEGQRELGVTLFAAAAAWRLAHGVPLLPVLRTTYISAVNRARSAMAPASFERAWGEGETAALDEAIDLANTMSM